MNSIRLLFGLVLPAALATVMCASHALAAGSNQADIQFISPANVYTLPVQMGAGSATKEMQFVLDTGAAYIIVPPADLVGVTKEKIGTIPLLLGGKIAYTMIRYRVASFQVGDCDMKDVEVDATDATSRPVLGQSFLRQVEPYTINGKTLTFSCGPQTVAENTH